MQRNISAAARFTAMALFACFISFFVYLSFYVIVRGISTHVTGYTVYELDGQGGAAEIGTVESKPAEEESNRRYVAVYSEIPASAAAVMGVLQLICGVGVYFCTTGTVIAKIAARDRNDADFNDAVFDKNKGLKIGLFAAIPSAILYIATLVLRMLPPSAFSHIYYWFYRWLILSPVKPVADLITGNAATLEAAPVWSVAVLAVFTLLIAVFCYAMYRICYNEDSVISKLLYKSTKKENGRRLGGR